MKRLVLTVAALAVLNVAPSMSAFSQNLETGTAADTFGGGNIGYNSSNVPAGTTASGYGLNSPETNAIAGESSGLHAFAMVPGAHKAAHRHRAASNPPGYGIWDFVSPGAGPYDSTVTSPASTGGGSSGYNDSVLKN